MRPRAHRRTAVLETMIACAVIAVLPASHASAGVFHKRTAVAAEPAPGGNIVYRPAYPAQRTKAFYLSNYAGVVYPPVGNRDPLEPATTRRRAFRWFAAPAAQPLP